MKNGKSTLGFSYTYIEYGKFWSILLELFVEHKPWNWEECRLNQKIPSGSPPDNDKDDVAGGDKVNFQISMYF